MPPKMPQSESVGVVDTRTLSFVHNGAIAYIDGVYHAKIIPFGGIYPVRCMNGGIPFLYWKDGFVNTGVWGPEGFLGEGPVVGFVCEHGDVRPYTGGFLILAGKHSIVEVPPFYTGYAGQSPLTLQGFFPEGVLTQAISLCAN